MHLGKSAAAQHNTKPYQGVRVKDPVKELLRRKRGSNTAGGPSIKTAPPTTVVVPNNTLPSFPHMGGSGFLEVGSPGNTDSAADVGAVYTGWIAQPPPTTLQPMAHWSPTEYLHPDSTDMFVQPVCPSYAVVGASSMLTLAHTPLFTNFGTISSSPSTLPQMDLQEKPLTYIPWAQPLAPLSGPAVQCSPCSPSLPMSMPMVLPEPSPQQLENTRTSLEKLLQEGEEVFEGPLFPQGV
ncbi:POU domain class 2-associating factor 1 [Denticeps clupeoides]|uniref:OCA domain-containing protein n=1 Tax=Denticeps clupeoides TaxID=299321 RepID=A0AAY4CUW7_9TELE|nr:POU domain class 2-associating factor 1 [Denticeps clupeoides]